MVDGFGRCMPAERLAWPGIERVRHGGQLIRAAAEAFRAHPDHEIITSFPGLTELTGERVLAEIGDDRTSPRPVPQAYAGSAPVTRASGRSISITHRRVKNESLNAVGFLWAFAAIPRPGPAKEHYDRRCATWSTGCSAGSTIACEPARPMTRSKPSDRRRYRRCHDWLHRSDSRTVVA